ncbi:hypothetical protein BZG21_45780, partial [Escherichia coli]|nr:hypothetical protein [Escherichia coli]
MMMGHIASMEIARNELQALRERHLGGSANAPNRTKKALVGERIELTGNESDNHFLTSEYTAELLRQARGMAEKWISDLQWESPHTLYPENSMSRMFHPVNFNFGWTGMVHVLNQLG